MSTVSGWPLRRRLTAVLLVAALLPMLAVGALAAFALRGVVRAGAGSGAVALEARARADFARSAAHAAGLASQDLLAVQARAQALAASARYVVDHPRQFPGTQQGNSPLRQAPSGAWLSEAGAPVGVFVPAGTPTPPSFWSQLNLISHLDPFMETLQQSAGSPDLVRLWLMTPDGMVRAAPDPGYGHAGSPVTPRTHLTQAPWYRDAAAAAGAVWTPAPFPDPAGGPRSIVSVSVPVRDAAGHLAAVVGADASVATLAASVGRSLDASEIALLTPAGRWVAGPPASQAYFARPGRVAAAEAAARAGTAVASGPDLVAAATLRPPGWILAAASPAATVLGPAAGLASAARAEREIELAGVLGALVVAVLAVWVAALAARRTTRPLEALAARIRALEGEAGAEAGTEAGTAAAGAARGGGAASPRAGEPAGHEAAGRAATGGGGAVDAGTAAGAAAPLAVARGAAGARDPAARDPAAPDTAATPTAGTPALAPAAADPRRLPPAGGAAAAIPQPSAGAAGARAPAQAPGARAPALPPPAADVGAARGAGPATGPAGSPPAAHSGDEVTLVVREFDLMRSRLREASARVREAALQRARAEQSAEVARLEDRNALARDVHDNLAQGFVALQMLGEAAMADAAARDWAAVARRLPRIAEVARDGLAQARASVRDLMPAPDLAEALRREAARLAIPVDVRVDGEPGRLPGPVRGALAAIAREALTNVGRHARAASARVTLTCAGDTARLEVADDGVGIGAGGAGDDDLRGFGLSTMEARAAAVGGRLRVVSTPGGGTTLIVEVARP